MSMVMASVIKFKILSSVSLSPMFIDATETEILVIKDWKLTSAQLVKG